MNKKLTATVLMALCLTCVWIAPVSAENQLVAPEAGYGMVYVIRPVEVQPQMQFYVYVDETNKDNLIGHTLGGQHLYFQVTPGEHIIYSSAKNIRSIKINIKEGETAFIRQRVRIDPRDATNQDNLEIIPEEAALMLLKNSTEGHKVER